MAENILAHISGTKYGTCEETQQIIQIFIIHQIQLKLMTKFSNKLKKPCFGTFWNLFPNFGVKKILSEIPALSCTISCEFLAPCQISEKSIDAIPRKTLGRKTDGRTEGRTDSIL